MIKAGLQASTHNEAAIHKEKSLYQCRPLTFAIWLRRKLPLTGFQRTPPLSKARSICCRKKQFHYQTADVYILNSMEKTEDKLASVSQLSNSRGATASPQWASLTDIAGQSNCTWFCPLQILWAVGSCPTALLPALPSLLPDPQRMVKMNLGMFL